MLGSSKGQDISIINVSISVLSGHDRSWNIQSQQHPPHWKRPVKAIALTSSSEPPVPTAFTHVSALNDGFAVAPTESEMEDTQDVERNNGKAPPGVKLDPGDRELQSWGGWTGE